MLVGLKRAKPPRPLNVFEFLSIKRYFHIPSHVAPWALHVSETQVKKNEREINPHQLPCRKKLPDYFIHPIRSCRFGVPSGTNDQTIKYPVSTRFLPYVFTAVNHDTKHLYHALYSIDDIQPCAVARGCISVYLVRAWYKYYIYLVYN